MFSSKILKKLREENKLSQSYIANLLGINRSSYNSWETGRAVPNQKNREGLATIFNIPITYFESEYTIVNNYLQLNEENQEKAENYVENLLQTQLQEDIIPLYPIKVLSEVSLSAGLGEALFDEEETITVYSTEEHFGYDIAAWITGDSMEPIYQDGEVALIKANGFDYDGAVYALSWNDNLYIKKLYCEKEGFRMVSLNDKYSEQFIPYEDNPRIVGIVISHFMPVVGG